MKTFLKTFLGCLLFIVYKNVLCTKPLLSAPGSLRCIFATEEKWKHHSDDEAINVDGDERMQSLRMKECNR